jgi:hypothetical protein
MPRKMRREMPLQALLPGAICAHLRRVDLQPRCGHQWHDQSMDTTPSHDKYVVCQ